ncbi:MAG: phosphate ABC transporter permease subunit PstC [Syntrophomonas sp.]|uniref:phosphate ABC transporter permease subunit PstC n=1 Tax=Syntrophomonas sp. TaxID=2053627 RepID=UPI0026346C56|nr:phosphate ABC transporter permease subunit PstC [Syntrophomonas sp.]MDD4627550.1 phosphate ABC transporter permease subunit PstC [Syntrophomonas sp.]
MNGIIGGEIIAAKQHNNLEGKSQFLQTGRWERGWGFLWKSKAEYISESLVEKLLMLSAVVSIMALLLISVFIFSRGVPLIAKVGLGDFLFSLEWRPTQGVFGIGAMFIGSLVLTLASLVWAVPLGLLTAVFMAEIAPPPLIRIMTCMVNLLAGIPSVVYGFFGLVIIVPLIRNYLGGTGMSVLAGAVILGIMILPTIINISQDAIQAVPREYKESSLALGASHYQTIGRLILPAASSGIITAVVLAMGRAIGETMAVVMVTGNAPIIPDNLLAPLRTMTSNIVLEMGYAAGDHQAALFATGAILFIFILLLNLVLNSIRRAGKRYAGN